MSVSFEEPEAADTQVAGDQILGDDVYEWTSPDGRHVITFGRPRGLVSLKVARILGPQQSANPVLDAFYKCICGIRKWVRDGVDLNFVEPATDMQFEMWFAMLGDEQLNAFCLRWQAELFGDALRAMQEAMNAGESPEALARIGRNAGMQHSKRSRKAK